MNTIQRAALFFCLVLMIGVASAAAQNPYEVETKPPRGFMPTADQLSSPVDSIDPVSGKLHLEIPLASLPPGRAGSGFDLDLVYDSHLYDLLPLMDVSVYTYNQPEVGHLLWGQGTTGGWHYNIDNFKIETEQHIDMAEYPNCTSANPSRVYRLRVGLLDGSLHTMQLKEFGSEMNDAYQGDGFFGINPFTGFSNTCAWSRGGWPQQASGLLTYYSTDSSYLKLEILPDGSGNPFNAAFSLYFPDGRRATGHASRIEALYDANGNGIYFNSGCYDPPPSGDCSLLYRSIADDTGREIRLNYNVGDLPNGGANGYPADTITAAGPNGPMTWSVNWEPLQIGQDGRNYVWSTAPWDSYPYYPLGTTLQVVKYVQLPLAAATPSGQAPPVWNSYAFGYADDADGGFGEVDSVRMPTGSLYQYRYTLEGTLQGAEDIANNNAVRERKITHDGITDLVWEYNHNSVLGNTAITNPDGTQSVYWFDPPDNYRDSATPNSSTGVGRVVYRVDEPNGEVHKRVWSRNDVPGIVSFAGGFYFVQNPWIRRETTTVGDATGNPALTSVTDRMIDKNGNLLQTTEYDWVNFNPSGPETGTVPRRVTEIAYYAEVPDATTAAYSPYEYWNPHFYPLTTGSPRRLDAVRRKEVSDGAGKKAAISEFAYDDAYRAGNVTSEFRWDNVKSVFPPGLGLLSAANSQVLTRSYGANGNVADIYEPEIRTHITYDANGNVPVEVNYAYGTAEQRSWGYSWNASAGTLNSKTDLDNNITTSYTYDIVGRQRSVNEAGLRKTETIYDDANRRVTVKKDLNSFGDGQLQATTQSDQLGRSVLVQSPEPGNPDGINVKSIYYPALNRTVRSSPYRTSSDVTLQWTCTQTDHAGHETAVAMFKGGEPTDCEATANRTGITRSVYNANQTTITDPAGAARSEYRDGLSHLIQFHEDPSTLNYVTNYQYDPLDRLTQTIQSDGAMTQTRTFNYSSLGRLISASNPESGAISYAYLDSGDLFSRSDARGVVATNSYDGLHRVRTKSYAGDGGVTPNVTYTYYEAGAPSGSIGQLESVASSAATAFYGGYDALGRANFNSQTIRGDAYTFQYSYRLNDGLSAIQYPSGKTVEYAVDSAGRTIQVSAGAKIYTNLSASSTPFTADGQIAQMKLGNDLWETRMYQTPGSPTMLKLGTTAGGNDRIELDYNYSATSNNGNLASQVIRQGSAAWTQNFSYDAVNRLSNASETGGFNRTYGYDRFGNRWVAASSGITAWDPHEPTVGNLFDKSNNRLANQSYDAAGNQASYDPRTMAYDAENRMIAATSSINGSEAYLYDGDGRRVRKTWTPNGGTTQVTTYVYGLNGQVAAEYTNQNASSTGTSWMFTDLLGSVRAVTGEKPQSGSASMTECYDYLPFGRMLSSSDNGRNTGCYPASPDYALSSAESPKFTGKVRDVETGLDFFGARYFSAAQGRFTSPDALFADQSPTDPQSWNLYAYVGNNPLRFVDSNGKWKAEIHTAIINGAFAFLTDSQRSVMEAASVRVDDFLNGGQTSANAYMHGMRGNFQTADAARKLADSFISDHESNATAIAIWSDGVSDAALDEFGMALHTVSDRLSPAHAGEQLWTGAGEPGVTTAVGGLAGFIVGAATDAVRAEIHNRKEKTITLEQFHKAIDAERKEYLKTFGKDAFTQATGCKDVFKCEYDDSKLSDEFRTGQ